VQPFLLTAGPAFFCYGLGSNPDGTTRENSYGGCGCAGGEVTTVRDEASRRKRYTKDALGRLRQVEELNYDQTVYSTTTYSYNPLDQLTQINQAGQLRSFGYDVYGRLQTRTTPEQGTTTYSYFADDTVQTVTDARGATTTFAYNARRLPTSITCGVPSGVAATPNVSFGYDGAGNRTSMTDGPGNVSYAYDQLSRLTSETRSFTGLGPFTLTYGYNVASELTSVTNPWSAQVGYTYDYVGRLTDVTGSGYAGVTSYASGLQYRAFGALKQITYGNTKSLSMEYDSRMRLSKWDMPNVLGYTYDYSNNGENSTGRVTFAHSLYDNTLDRAWHYDQVGRLDQAYSGSEARAFIGTEPWGNQTGPYAQNYQYDQLGNMTHRVGWGGWMGSVNNEAYLSYTNNRLNGLGVNAQLKLTPFRSFRIAPPGRINGEDVNHSW
jgi:YD repeat-containing protein